MYSVSQLNSKHLAYNLLLLHGPSKQEARELAHRDAQYMQSALRIPKLLVVHGNGWNNKCQLSQGIL